MSVDTQRTTRRYIPEYGTLQNYLFEATYVRVTVILQLYFWSLETVSGDNLPLSVFHTEFGMSD
jgi:hypothetical protein